MLEKGAEGAPTGWACPKTAVCGVSRSGIPAFLPFRRVSPPLKNRLPPQNSGKLLKPGFPGQARRYRWAVERTIAWLKNFRRLRVRDERRADIHLAWLILACAMICLHQL